MTTATEQKRGRGRPRKDGAVTPPKEESTPPKVTKPKVTKPKPAKRGSDFDYIGDHAGLRFVFRHRVSGQCYTVDRAKLVNRGTGLRPEILDNILK
jgi:hypothetical protein